MNVADLESTLRAQAEEIESLKRENKRLSDEMTLLLRQLFHKKSERLSPEQMRLFAEMTGESIEPEPETLSPPRKKVRPGHGRALFPEHLQRKVIDLDLPEEERSCAECGCEMRVIGTEVTERGHIVPARCLVHRYERKKYACPNGHGVRTPELPPSVIEKCKYEPSVFANLTVAKYGDHIPLHRLSGIYKRNGFSLPKTTMWEMLQRVDEIVAQPILAQMRKEILEERIIQGDETPVTFQVEDGKGSAKGYIWSYGNGKKRLFEFTKTRERTGPKTFLRGWDGTLQTDGYSGYDEAVRENDLVRAGCLSHARRKVKDALDTGSTNALRLLRPIQRLFRIERAARRRAEAQGLSETETLALVSDVRSRLSRRTTEHLWREVTHLSEERTTLPKSTLGKAVTYLQNQWTPLTRFLDDPELAIHNNDCERALRHVVTGRKNWLFFGSEKGGRVGANLFSIVAACKALEIHPERYLEDVLERVSNTPQSEVGKLTPWAWAEENGTV